MKQLVVQCSRNAVWIFRAIWHWAMISKWNLCRTCCRVESIQMKGQNLINNCVFTLLQIKNVLYLSNKSNHSQSLDTIQSHFQRDPLICCELSQESVNCVGETCSLCLDRNQPFSHHLLRLWLAILVRNVPFLHSICQRSQFPFWS